MAKRFYFDDSDDEQIDLTVYDIPVVKEKPVESKPEPEPKKKKPTKKETKKATKKKAKKPVSENNSQQTEEAKPKKKKSGKFKKICLMIFAVLIIGFVGWIWFDSLETGPVYANRGKGLKTEITEKDMSTVCKDIKEEYSQIKSIDMEIACKQLKLNIVFDQKVKAAKAEDIAKDAIKTLDKKIGMDKSSDHTYSKLFGVIDGVGQYEVNVYMVCDKNDDFPIYGTKSVTKDSFSWTLASVKDKESAKKAQDTLKDKK